MRIGAIFDPRLPNSAYRCVVPLRELQARGHQVVVPAARDEQLEQLLACDAVLAHRQYGPATRDVVPLLAGAGVAVVCDNDDDLAAVPVESPHHEALGGARGEEAERAWLDIAHLAHAVTTPSTELARRWLADGLDRVDVIENLLPAEFVGQPRRAHEGVVVGWIAGLTHRADADRLGIPGVLRRLLDARPGVRVATIGLDLALGHPRYSHIARVPWPRLLHTAAAFDIGIAPLADMRFNRGRSDVKLKEYAALGIPWLASPVGPYRDLGAEQGGEHVPDGDWLAALERLVDDAAERRRRGTLAHAWASTKSIAGGARRWEAVFERAISAARASP